MDLLKQEDVSERPDYATFGSRLSDTFGVYFTLGFSMTRRLNRQEMPALCMLFGFIFAIAAIEFWHSWRIDLASPQELQKLKGRVERIEHTNLPKAGAKIHIYVRDGASLQHLTQDDLDYFVPAMRNLHDGDFVVAYAKPDSVGRNLYWLWSLECEGEQLLSYDQTLSHLLDTASRMRPFAMVQALFPAYYLSSA